MLSKSYLCLARVLYSKRDIAGAKEVLDRLDDLARASDLPPHVPGRIAAWQVRIWLAEDELEVASQWAKGRGLCPGRVPSYGEEAEALTLACILCKPLRDATAYQDNNSWRAIP
jgi:ATP/maltotriose-dependent transcriptional regulator MalT